MSDRMQEAVEAIEQVIEKYQSVFAPNLDMPVLTDWCFIVAHEDMTDPTQGGVYRLNRPYQSSYRSAGLLQQAMDDYRHVTVSDD